ncbi:MAG: ABC transporter ATP-binding protein [Velocimicrobium sp.]
MLHLEQVNKSWNDFSLKDITFDLPTGYIMGLIGPNGSGKTTLLHIIMGLYSIDFGSVNMDGNDIYEKEKIVKNKIGFVLNEELFTGTMTLGENATMYGGYYDTFRMDVFETYCKRFGLDLTCKLKKQSKGEKLKFQFAFALSHNPSLLILDEPTASFDPEFRNEFIRIVTDFVKDGKHSVILATHLTEELDQIADYITFINHGTLVCSMDKETLLDSYRVVSGEDYKLNLLSKKGLVYKEKGTYLSKALVEHGIYASYDKELIVLRPTIEEIMYYTIKGEMHR